MPYIQHPYDLFVTLAILDLHSIRLARRFLLA